MVTFGLDTFGDVTTDTSYGQVIRNVVEQATLADRLGIDAFGVGEHHRDDYAISSPEIVLAAIAARTERIILGTAVTVLSSDDPVRVYERFATLDAVSNGRAEIILGRGSFTESFPLFGYDLADYEQLFSEKLDLMAHLLDPAHVRDPAVQDRAAQDRAAQDRAAQDPAAQDPAVLRPAEGVASEPVTWSGTIRPPLKDQHVYPKTESGRIPAWIGVGGSPESVVRAARYGMPLVLAIIGGAPARFAPYVELYHRALKELGQPSQPVAVHCPGFVAATDEEAVEVLWPHARRMLDRIGRERGWPPMTKDRFRADVTEGAWHVGSPETVARKIADTVQALGIERFDLKYSHGTLPHDRLMTCVELYGTQVVPRVREILGQS